jgi:hypothetical protein
MTKKATDWSVPIIVALIGVFGTCITAFFTVPAFQTWVGAFFPHSDSKSLDIEQIPQEIFAYADNNPDGGWGTFWVVYDDKNSPIYKLDYFLPGDKHGYAGLAFKFVGGSSLSAYDTVECVVVFSQLSDVVDLYFKDIASNFNTIRVANNGAKEMVLRYEFTNFPNINFNAVKEFGIVVSTDFSTGSHQVRIKNVRFTK